MSHASASDRAFTRESPTGGPRGRRLAATLLCGAAVAASLAALPAPASADQAPSAGAGGGASTAAKVVVLKQGDRGPAVKRLQRRLNLSADGAFGGQTKRAVKRFQKRNGLTADGVVGPLTRRALGLRAFAQESVFRRGKKRKRSSRPRSGAMKTLQQIAECESGGDPEAISSTGRYRGKYQFSRSTWRANGGTGDPAKAGEAEQDRIALRLYRAEGLDPWPVCGKQRLG